MRDGGLSTRDPDLTAALALRIDPASGEFRPAELRLRGPDGGVLTEDPVVTAIELSSPDLVTATPGDVTAEPIDPPMPIPADGREEVAEAAAIVDAGATDLLASTPSTVVATDAVPDGG